MSADEPTSYNLIDQTWLRVRRIDGRLDELSIVDTVAQAHTLTGLVGEVPTQVFALTRVLLAILHAAVDGPRDIDHWEALWEQEQLPVDLVTRYLTQYRERFDLFHPVTPFFQVADLRTAKGEVSELNRLIADVPNGHPFFSTRMGPDLSLPVPEAARWLVHCQAFDPSGIKSGAVGDSRVKGGRGYPIGTGWSGLLGGVFPEGATVRETLLLNLIARDFDDSERWVHDAPAWHRPQLGPDEEVPGGRSPAGPMDLYTWQSRRVRLVREHDRVVKVLVCNGDRLTPQNINHVEPHTAWRRSKAQEKKLGKPLVYMPREHDPKRAIWRGLQSLLPGSDKVQGADAATAISPIVLEWLGLLSFTSISADHPVRVRAVGMVYGSQSSTTEDIIDDALTLRPVLLQREATELAGIAVSCVTAAEHAARTLGSLAGNLAAAAGGDPEAPNERATELGYAELDVGFRAWIAALGADSDPMQVQVDWHTTVHRIVRQLADDLLERASATAWVGRMVGGKLVTSSHADGWFRADLRRCLPLACTQPPDSGTS